MISILAWVEQTVRAAGSTPTLALKARLVVEELCAKAVAHGGSDKAAPMAGGCQLTIDAASPWPAAREADANEHQPESQSAGTEQAGQPDRDAIQLQFSWPGAPLNPFDFADQNATTGSIMERPVGRLGLVLIQGLTRYIRYEYDDGRNRLRFWL